MTPIGKIARLPQTIRDQLNHRLADGVRGNTLLNWLNSLPEVQAILAAEFGGQPINKQNLCAWRQRGYRDWLAQQEAQEMLQRITTETAELQAAAQGSVVAKLSQWIATKYLVATQTITDENGQIDWQRLRELNR